MIWDREAPCASCPYRKDAPLRLWHRSEFENLLAQNTNEIGGRVFGCHEFNKRPPASQRPCVGWLLDQRANGTRSIQLRLVLMTNAAAAACYDKVHATGLKLFRTVEAMCRANGVRR